MNERTIGKPGLGLSLLLTLSAASPAYAQDDKTLHVLKAVLNAESKNAEICLQFDKTLAEVSPSKLASALKLEADGEPVTPPNVAAANAALCVFPLERNISYRLTVRGLRGANGEKMSAPYASSFVIPDRSASLSFAGESGGINEFGSYDRQLTLRAVNVKSTNLSVYSVTDIPAMAHIWQDRAMMALAPSESSALARSKGNTIWREDLEFNDVPNIAAEHKISLREKMPHLTPGLYLIVAEASSAAKRPTGKKLSPLAAAWFTKSDFSLRALRDSDGVHVIATGGQAPKDGVKLTALGNEAETVAEAQTGADGLGVLRQPADKNAPVSVIGVDQSGNVAFADIENLPSFLSTSYPDALRIDPPFAGPLDPVNAVFSPLPATQDASVKSSSLLRLSLDDTPYADIPMPPEAIEAQTFPLRAPATAGQWSLRWMKPNETVLAETKLDVMANTESARLEASSERASLSPDRTVSLSVSSVSSSGKPFPLAGGRILFQWQKLDTAAAGWKNYRFGMPFEESAEPVSIAAFLTDPNGSATLHLTLPPPPPKPGLYQAFLNVTAETDSGIAAASPLVLPLRPEKPVVGIKPLAENARFPQNGIARFSLIAVSSDGKPHDLPGLSYQIYEEGRSFAWYQDEGRWNYKPEAQLRPIAGGSLSIRADAGTKLDWPVTAGNYRLEILDSNGNVLAQTAFGAGSDARPATPISPLTLIAPETLPTGREGFVRVHLPEPAMLSAVVADTHIRKVVHELRPKGDNEISFTPSPEWGKSISVSIEAIPQNGPLRRATTEIRISGNEPGAAKTAEALIVPAIDPSSIVLRKGDSVTVSFAFKNASPSAETFHYAFSASGGLDIKGPREGTLSLGSKQSKTLVTTLTGSTLGQKELRLDISGGHNRRTIRNWPMAVLPERWALNTAETIQADPGQSLSPTALKRKKETAAFVARLPMKGLGELLSALLNARPFSTEELALNLDALRLWRDALDRSGMAPDFVVKARERVLLTQMLKHRNPDGSFGPYRGSAGTMTDTAAALTTLARRESGRTDPAAAGAIAWIKQRLANTWFDEDEHRQRAAAYAALAAADAIDPASLHYFSDTGAAKPLPAIAEAQIAAAFKHIREPDAAAFWIKKMLDENSEDPKNAQLLCALSATDALSSDHVQTAMAEAANAIQKGTPPGNKDIAALLRAVAANNALAGKIRIEGPSGSHAAAGVLALSA
ncbi:MAG: hypothetical protein PHE27_04180, partial [Alphaproteobacteria bacterium]|nr:hypothetical protein [Alphaproteobacteria bacterium]